MESKTGRDPQKTERFACQLPITNFAHKTAIVGNASVAAVLASLEMTAENHGAAVSIALMTLS